MGQLTTHILDTASGAPAAGVRITVTRRGDGAVVARATTNVDGRCDAPLLAGDAFAAGEYEIDFAVGEYFAARGVASFLTAVPVRFVVADASQHYHVPLLLSPFGYSTYRGS